MPPPDDEFDDDRPRRRRPRRDDDDEDEEDDDGRLRRRRRAKSNNKQVLIIVAVAVGLTVLACGGVAVLLLLPAVMKVREVAGRAQSSNNMKQVGLAAFTHVDMHDSFPAPFAHPDGNPAGVPADPSRRLSWRAALVPYMGLPAPGPIPDPAGEWDSVKNKPFSDTPVMPFSDPAGGTPAASTQTRYRVFTGNGALFDLDQTKKPVKLMDILDGTSNTILSVQAGTTVPWAQCNELPFAPGGPVPPLGMPNGPVFLVGFADGSVRTVRKTVAPAVLDAAITYKGGENLPIPD